MRASPHSISRAIVVKSGATIAIVLVITAAFGYWLISSQLKKSFDHTMVAKAQILVTQVKELREGVEFDFADEFMPEYERESDPEYFQIWMGDSGVFERSNSLLQRDLPLLDLQTQQQVIHDIELPDGRRGRAVQIHFLPQIHEKELRTTQRIAGQKLMNLVIARERESLDTQLDSVASTIFFVVLMIVCVVLLLIKRNVQAGLAPLTRLQLAVSRTNIDNLDEWVDIGDPPEELAVLVEQLNRMAQRISESVKRERRFSSDVAHELKTPIAELLNLAEVAIRWPEKIDESADLYQDVLESSLTMKNIVTKLLMLSRCENGHIILEPEELFISDILDGMQRRLQSLAAEKSVQLSVDIDTDYMIHASRVEFELIIQNLVGNALQYSPVAATVVARAWVEGACGHVSVSNLAPDLEPGDIAVMFDRLWRKDESRAGEMNAGLGLSLVAAYADLLGIKVETELDNERCFTVHLSNLDVL